MVNRKPQEFDWQNLSRNLWARRLIKQRDRPLPLSTFFLRCQWETVVLLRQSRRKQFWCCFPKSVQERQKNCLQLLWSSSRSIPIQLFTFLLLLNIKTLDSMLQVDEKRADSFSAQKALYSRANFTRWAVPPSKNHLQVLMFGLSDVKLNDFFSHKSLLLLAHSNRKLLDLKLAHLCPDVGVGQPPWILTEVFPEGGSEEVLTQSHR